MQVVPNMLRGECGLVSPAGGGHEGEALALCDAREGAGAALVPDVQGGAGEEEDLFFDVVAYAVGPVGGLARHFVSTADGWVGLRNDDGRSSGAEGSDGVDCYTTVRVYIYIRLKVPQDFI